MTAEYLLDAMGCIDDDLIADADLPVKAAIPFPSPRQVRRWSSLAACLMLAVSLGWFFTHLTMGGHKSDSSAPAASAPAASTPAVESPSMEPSYGASTSVPVGSDPPESSLTGFRVLLTVDGLTYAYNHEYPNTDALGPWVDTLPEGCRYMGTVEPADNGSLAHTDSGVYEGCALWLEGEGENSTLYLEHPDGSYLVCEYSQTYVDLK